MAFPVAAIAAQAGLSTLIGAVSTVFSTAVGGMTGALLTPKARGTIYKANKECSNLVPDLSDMINLYNQGWGTDEQLADWLSYHGASNANTPLWEQIVESKQSYPTLDAILNAYFRGKIGDRQASEWSHRHGLRNPDVYDLTWKMPYKWNAEQVRTLWAISAIRNDDYDKFLKAGGLLLSEDREYFKKLYNPPPVEQILELLNRGDITEEMATTWLNLNGLTHGYVIDAIKGLRHIVPSPSDLVTFAVKEAFDANVVKLFGYDEEFPSQFEYWMRKTPLGGDPTDGGKIGAGSGLDSWARAYWRSHWKPISPEQAYRMEQRLRVDGGPNGTQRVPGVQPWTRNDTNTILKVQDYPKPFRDRLAALSYNVLRLVDIRRIVRLSIDDAEFKASSIGDGFTIQQWAKEQFKDRGQTDTDASSLAVLAVKEAQLGQSRQYAWIDRRRQKVAEWLFKLGLVPGGMFGGRLLQAVQDPTTKATAQPRAENLYEAERKLAIVKQTIACLKKSHIKGIGDREESMLGLIKLGMSEDIATQTVDGWDACNHHEEKQATTAQVVDWLKNGMLTLDEAYKRLTNLGWSDADQLLLTARAVLGMKFIRSGADMPASITSMGAAAELQQLRDMAIAEQKRIERQIKQLTPVSLLNYLYQHRRIGDDFYISRLEAMAYSSEEAHQMLEVQAYDRERNMYGNTNGAPAEENTTGS